MRNLIKIVTLIKNFFSYNLVLVMKETNMLVSSSLSSQVKSTIWLLILVLEFNEKAYPIFAARGSFRQSVPCFKVKIKIQTSLIT